MMWYLWYYVKSSVSRDWKSNYIPRHCVGCDYLSMPYMPAFCTHTHHYATHTGLTHWSLGDIAVILNDKKYFGEKWPCYQSGTKPNLVAKIWPPNLVTICAWLPKLVTKVSFNFHHLVNPGLAVGSFFKWLPITVAHTCKLDTIWVVYISPIGNGSIRL